MPRYGKLTCPNCGVKIRFVTLHRIRVLGHEEGRKRIKTIGEEIEALQEE